jgi:two-component system LytT family response regulator
MLPQINCVIVDDEEKAIDVLSQRLNILFPEIKITGKFTEWKKGLESLKTSKVDLLFMDISMPEKTGLDILKLFPSIPFQIIFVTAHSHFAVDAIKYQVAGYVLKPIDDYELSFAVNKALEKINKAQIKSVSGQQATIDNKLKIGIPNPKGVDYLNIDDILYFEGINKYTKVVTMEFSIMSSYNIAEFRKIVDSYSFFQVHRSYIINLNNIKRYETSGTLIMEDNMTIPVSKNVRAEFLNSFSKITRIAGLKNKESD